MYQKVKTTIETSNIVKHSLSYRE